MGGKRFSRLHVSRHKAENLIEEDPYTQEMNRRYEEGGFGLTREELDKMFQNGGAAAATTSLDEEEENVRRVAMEEEEKMKFELGTPPLQFSDELTQDINYQ